MKFSEYFTEARTTSKKKDVTKFKLPRRNLKKRKELKERIEKQFRFDEVLDQHWDSNNPASKSEIIEGLLDNLSKKEVKS